MIPLQLDISRVSHIYTMEYGTLKSISNQRMRVYGVYSRAL